MITSKTVEAVAAAVDTEDSFSESGQLSEDEASADTLSCKSPNDRM